VDAQGGRGFAHLHPMTTDSVVFTSVLPALPRGHYSVFADIVHESGFTQTLVADADVINELSVVSGGDADDSYSIGAPVEGALQVTLQDGSTMTWLRPQSAIVAGEDAELRFTISSP